MKEFTKLERIEIGGLKGRSLSSRIIRIYREFTENFTLFATRTYDVLDPEDKNFISDYLQYQKHIDNLDRQLASVLCQAFDECCNLDAIFKVGTYTIIYWNEETEWNHWSWFRIYLQFIDVIGSVMERPHVKEEISKKYCKILDLLEDELKVSRVSAIIFIIRATSNR